MGAARDYTDGGGWAKLDRTSAEKLADLCRGLTPNRVRMLLLIFQSIDEGGVTTIGRKVLAEMAGVSSSAAGDFINELVRDGTLIEDGIRKTSAGDYIVRHFYWIKPTKKKVGDFRKGRRGGAGADRPPVAGNPGENRHGVAGKPRENRPQQSCQNSRYGVSDETRCGAGRLGPPAPREQSRNLEEIHRQAERFDKQMAAFLTPPR